MSCGLSEPTWLIHNKRGRAEEHSHLPGKKDTKFRSKKTGRPTCVERPGWRSPPGRRETVYMDGGVVLAVGLGVVGVCAGAPCSPVVLVIKCTSTRRFLARPSRVLFESTGLS